MTPPFLTEIQQANTILLAGAGGGFDIFSGLPLYFWLRSLGKTVHLANLSFTTVYATNGERTGASTVRINANTEPVLRYFPEIHLAKWLKTQGEPDTIYCLDRAGVRPISGAYQTLTLQLQPDALVLVDGGTDSLMRGDEHGLGTPQEDMASMLGAASVLHPNMPKYLLCLGFGIDHFHGVPHHDVLEAIAAITLAGGYLGAWPVMSESVEAGKYKAACEYAFTQMHYHPSIVNTSILSAIEGHFGNYHANYRTEGSTLFINPLMALY
jgi:hypothetical protein